MLIASPAKELGTAPRTQSYPSGTRTPKHSVLTHLPQDGSHHFVRVVRHLLSDHAKPRLVSRTSETIDGVSTISRLDTRRRDRRYALNVLGIHNPVPLPRRGAYESVQRELGLRHLARRRPSVSRGGRLDPDRVGPAGVSPSDSPDVHSSGVSDLGALTGARAVAARAERGQESRRQGRRRHEESVSCVFHLVSPSSRCIMTPGNTVSS
jgi:hypothetical protein